MTPNRVTVEVLVMMMIGAVHRRARAGVAHQVRLIDHPTLTQKEILGQAGAEAPLKKQVNTSAPFRLLNISRRNS